jgi:hypothetical protein
MNPLPTLPSGDLAQGTLGPPCLTSTTPHPPLANILYLAVLLLTGVCGTQKKCKNFLIGCLELIVLKRHKNNG